MSIASTLTFPFRWIIKKMSQAALAKLAALVSHMDDSATTIQTSQTASANGLTTDEVTTLTTSMTALDTKLSAIAAAAPVPAAPATTDTSGETPLAT